MGSDVESPDSNSQDLPVRFIPPLAHERQRWIMETLRLNNARSVLDIGCGEGSLLSALCSSASSIPSDPPDSHLSTPIRDLFLERVAALDIDPDVIDDAVHAATSNCEPHYLAPWGSGEDGWYIRWAPLEASVWQGGLEVLNSEFYKFDAIVSTEVIEHVPESILPAFSYVLLEQYRPRLLVLTTPNFTFNARFHPPGVPRKGYLDPTGKTTRVFRHSDHKREWTVPEFTEWCQEAACLHGYNVTLDGVGVPTEPDPFDRELGYASQTAVFVRREPGVESLSLESMSISGSWSPSAGPPHKLVARRSFDVDPRAGHPQSSQEIRSALVYLMQMRGEGELTFGELWSELAMPCGGSVAALVDALTERGVPQDDSRSMYAPPVEGNPVEDVDADMDAGDTVGQWSILPPRSPNHYTEPRWDRVVVWSGFQPRSYENEVDSSGGYHQEAENDIEVEYRSDESISQGGWDSGSNKGEGVAPVESEGGFGGWGGTRWGEWGVNEAAATDSWGDPETGTSLHEASAWSQETKLQTPI
ncbi:hypothetical protein FRC07_005225 [Ceratobasidium sp. 392]|nr:hypothetical protein FRC07_005225 [Ceratobasidium sp. 392]